MYYAIFVFCLLFFVIRPFVEGYVSAESKNKIRMMSYYHIIRIWFYIGWNLRIDIEKGSMKDIFLPFTKYIMAPRFNLPKTKFKIGDKFTVTSGYNAKIYKYLVVEIDYDRKVYVIRELDTNSSLLETHSFNNEDKMNFVKSDLIERAIEDS